MFLSIQTPLHLTVHTKQPRACRALVAAGVPLETMDRHGNTALHLACSQGNGACLQALTQKVTKEEQSEYRCRKKMEHNQQLPQNLELRNFDGKLCTGNGDEGQGVFNSGPQFLPRNRVKSGFMGAER